MSALFSTTTFSLGHLIADIERGSIGLPEIQRPFVWNRAKVRDLFDSLYRGFPVGHFLFWENPQGGTKRIGVEGHQVQPAVMIVDGQQRLTSLFAVVAGKSVIDANFKQQPIEIAFNPLTQEFKVTDAAIKNDAHWIASISGLFKASGDYEFIQAYLQRLSERRTEEIGGAERTTIANAISRLRSLTNYSFTAIILSKDISEEQAAEIFIRINAQGVSLKQSDFILTLMSVYWDEGRAKLEAFCRESKVLSDGKPSAFNALIDPGPDELLRVVIGYGFRRGRMKDAYSILRGRDADTGEYSDANREANFLQMKTAQERVLDLTNWHEFLKCLLRAGFRSSQLVSSRTTVLYAYTLFLIGRCDFGVPLKELGLLISRWFFMATVTSRYSDSMESQVDTELGKLRNSTSSVDFTAFIEREIDQALTPDFWTITLPGHLETSAARSPYLFTYAASLNLLDASVLFSDLKMRDLYDPLVKANKAALERHHLFPKAHLKKLGVDAVPMTNQIANYAWLHWPDNVSISGASPQDYAPELFSRMPSEVRQKMLFWHALPEAWWDMDYDQFLLSRRRLMARVIKAAYEHLAKGNQASWDAQTPTSLTDILDAQEGSRIEFKSTARWNLRESRKDEAMEMAVLKTIAGFLNAGGGKLLIGVADDQSIIGLQFDYETLQKKDADGFALWFTDVVDRGLGKTAASLIKLEICHRDGREVAIVHVPAAGRIIYLNPPRGPRVDEVWVRLGNSTRKLTPREIEEYRDLLTSGPSEEVEGETPPLEAEEQEPSAIETAQ